MKMPTGPAPSTRAVPPIEDQVESAKHRQVWVDEQVERADACFLLGHQLVVSFGEVLEVRVPAVGDRRSEERSIGQLERHHHGCVVGAKKLQLRHHPTLSIAPESSFRSPLFGKIDRADCGG